MITKVPTWMTGIVPVLYKFTITKWLLRPFYHIIRDVAESNKNKIFKKNGIKVLKDFDDIMMRNGIHYSVFAGTLLGAIREKGLLKHDLDLDTVMFEKNYSPHVRELLEAGGFRLLHGYYIDEGKIGKEETFIKDGVSIDIYFVYADKEFPTYQCDFYAEKGAVSHEDSMKKFGYLLARRIELPVSEEVRRVPFENIEVNVLANAEEWLYGRYGKNYMIPDPLFADKGDNPHIKNWDEVKATMIF